jgi:ribonuclease G
VQKEIFVNVDPRETRVAVVEGGQLVELHLEREERVVGSIYKAKVSNVLPGMDAAFVDIGLEKNAFLYVGDILAEDNLLPAERDDKHKPRPSSARRRSDPNVKIRDLVKPGQEVLVQVVKAPRGTKGARVSTRVSIAGRYLVFMPDAGNIGISRKIEETKERDRLKKIGDKIRTEGGIIIRTEAEGRSESDLRDDYEYLLRTWKNIQERARSAPPATIIHQELGLLFRVIRDMLSADVYAVVVDDKPDFDKALDLAKAISPKFADKVQHYSEKPPIFEAFGIEKEVNRLLKPKIWMKSGGYLLIDETEALTSIDVNTGKFVGSTSLNETILKTNLEAVTEIVRQLRFRDLGGMIVLDFIDMNSSTDRQTVMRALDTALREDRTRTKVAAISPLGLIEMTRKRTGENLTEALRDKCPYCEGRATIQSAITTAVAIDREVRNRAAVEDTVAYIVAMHPDVAAEFIGENGVPVDKLEAECKKAIYVRPDATAHREKHVIAAADVPTMDKQMKGLKPGKALTLTIQAIGSGDELRPIAWYNGILVDIPNAAAHIGQTLPAKLTKVSRSYMVAELVGVPPVVALEATIAPVEREPYVKAEAKIARELESTTALEREFATDARGRDRDRHRRREKPREDAPDKQAEVAKPIPVEVVAPTPAPVEVQATEAGTIDKTDRDGRRRRRRRGRRDDREAATVLPVAFADAEEAGAELSIAVMPPHPLIGVPVVMAEDADVEHELTVTQSSGRAKRRWQWRRRRKPGEGGGPASGGE